MKISYITTTACGDPLVANHLGEGGLTAMTLGDRAQLLHDKILPAAADCDEIFVVGRYPDSLADAFPDITFITLPPFRRDRIEAFREREVGARFSTGDILICAADDHMLGEGFVSTLRDMYDEEWDILTPRRLNGSDFKTEMNNGSDGLGSPTGTPYSPWHCHVIRRRVWAQIPWTSHETIWLDIVLPAMYADIGAKMVWTDKLTAIDLCAAAGEM